MIPYSDNKKKDCQINFTADSAFSNYLLVFIPVLVYEPHCSERYFDYLMSLMLEILLETIVNKIIDKFY